MARVTTPLTNTEVKNAKPREKEYNPADGDGLQLRVKTNGSKLWLFNYYHPYSKKRANLGFGKYPQVTLALARKKLQQARELLARDIDPKSHREEAHQLKKNALENTFLLL